jgi:hypothetical protein
MNRDRHAARYLTPREVAASYGFSEGTLANMRSRRVGPPFIKMKKKVLYRVDHLENWLNQHRVVTQEE